MNSSKSSKIFRSRKILLENLKKHLENQKKNKIILEIEEYIDSFPTEYFILDQLYASFMNEIGSTEVSQGISKLIAETNVRLRNQGKKHFGLPPIMQHTHLLDRVGELADQTAAVSQSFQLGNIHAKPILPILNLEKISNSAFLPYLLDTFDVLTNPEEVKYYLSKMPLSPFNSVHLKYSDSIFGSFSDASANVADLLISRNKNPFPFSLKEETLAKALLFLKKFNVSEKDEFVTLHLREGDNKFGEQHNWRNINVADHQEAIQWLLNNGIKVIRIGDKSMTPMESHKGLIDLSSITRIPEVDLFLCAKCLFYYGNPSGPSSIASLFGRPMFYTSLTTYAHSRFNALNQITPMIDKSTNKILNLEKLHEMDISTIFAPKPLLRKNLVLKNINPSEHLECVKEMMVLINKSTFYLIEDEVPENLEKIGLSKRVVLASTSKNLLLR